MRSMTLRFAIRYLAPTLLAVSIALTSRGIADLASIALQAWFQARTQALFDAVASGDRAVWDQTLDENCILTSEDGEVTDKAKFLAELHPLPPGFQGHIVIRDLTVRDLGATAVVHYWIDESETIFAQELKTLYVATDTYRRTGDTWRALAMQVTVVPRDLEPIVTDQSAWPAIVGSYRYPGDTQPRYRVFLRDGKLFGGRDEKTATPLIPLAPLVFHQQGSIHLMVFVRDAAGEIEEVRELHKYNEVRMQRVPSRPAGS
jgi:hypothetical protein